MLPTRDPMDACLLGGTVPKFWKCVARITTAAYSSECMAAEIPRHLDPILRQALTDHRIVHLSGARQVGKSTLVRAIQASDPARFDFVDLDDVEARETARADPMGFLDRPGRCVIIDEVQRVPDLVLPLKTLVDRDPRPGRFLLTGSADLWAVQEPGAREALTGRLHPLRLRPLTQAEVAVRAPTAIDRLFAGDDPTDHTSARGRADYLDLAQVGGFPSSLTGSSLRARQEWLRSYADLRTREDATTFHGRRRYLGELPTLLRLLAARSSQVLNVSSLGDDLPMSLRSVPEYIDLLEQLFLLEVVPAWSGNLGRRVVDKPKVYIADPGLMAAVVGLRSSGAALNHDEMAGPLIETFVVDELIRLAPLSEVAATVHHLRTYDQVEVDVILEADDGRVVAIEVKAGRRARGGGRGLRLLKERLGDRFVAGLILTSAPTAARIEDRIYHAPIDVLWDWGAPRPSPAVAVVRPASAEIPAPRPDTAAAPADQESTTVTTTTQSIPGPRVFIGYARVDEEATGAVSRLEDGLRRAFGVLSSPQQELQVFRDVTGIRWGEDWQARIDEELDAATFYIPVMSPRFFDSGPCRDEAEKLLARVDRDPGRREDLVLPVYLIDVPDLDASSTDPLKRRLSAISWSDLRATVMVDDGEALRRETWAMAQAIREKVDAHAAAAASGATSSSSPEDDAEGLDLAELMGAFEDFEAVQDEEQGHLEEVLSVLQGFMGSFRPGASRSDLEAAARRAAADMADPLDRLEEVLRRATRALTLVDRFIDEVPLFLSSGVASREQVLDLARTFGSGPSPDRTELQQIRDVLRMMGLTTTAMRQPMKRLSAALDETFRMAEATGEWSARLVRAAGG